LAKIVSFGADIPGLKAAPNPWEEYFAVTLEPDFVSFAGRSELCGIVGIATNWTTRLVQRFSDKGVLIEWLRSTLNMSLTEAQRHAESVAQGERSHLPYIFDPNNIREIGFHLEQK